MFVRKTNPKAANLWIRVRPEDKALIFKKAKDCHLSASEFLVRAALGRQTRSRAENDLIVEISTYIDLLRTIHAAKGPMPDLQRALDASVAALCKITSS